jgi:hypothetical protein
VPAPTSPTPAPEIPASFWIYLGSRFSATTAMAMMRATIAWHVFDLSQSAF